MLLNCKTCNQAKPTEAFPMRHWKTKNGEARSGPRKRCYECEREHNNARYNAPNSPKRAAKQQYDAAHKTRLAEYRKAYYEANKHKWLDRETGWRFSPRAKTYDALYYMQETYQNRKKLVAKTWRAANRPRLLAKTRARQDVVKRATPVWSNPDQILEYYKASARRTEITGVVHHVDHYYPLTSDQVCGLHVPANLRVIPAFDNISKANKMPY